jgi:Flp pilus assembly protein TadG
MMRRAIRSDEGGQSLVEFALILPVLLLIITGVFDVARAAWQENTLAYAAREGTRYAIVHGSAAVEEVSGVSAVAWSGLQTQNWCSSDETRADPATLNYCQPVFSVVRNAAVGVPNVTVKVTWPDCAVPGCYDRNYRVQVDASAPFVPLPSRYLLGGVFQITLRGGSMLVIQR